MAAPTEVYVDPAIAADSGTGTIGDPFGDLQYALNNTTRDATSGNQFNIKAGTDEILSTALSLTTYGTPVAGAPLIFRGYTSAANDGGIGGISGGGSVSIIASSTLDYILFVDMHLHNCGSSAIVQLDDFVAFINCEIDNTTLYGLQLGGPYLVAGCHIHNCGTYGIVGGAGTIIFNHFEQGANAFDDVLRLSGAGCTVLFNVFDVSGATRCHVQTTANSNDVIMFNSFYGGGGTGQAIFWSGGAAPSLALNNIIADFSGAGAIGINADAMDLFLHGANVFYNNTTNNDIVQDVLVDLGLDQTPGSSPFTDAANDDFTLVSALKALGFPTANYTGLAVRSHNDPGALQREEAAGGNTARARYLMGIS